jgi:hypothetical protein
MPFAPELFTAPVLKGLEERPERQRRSARCRPRYAGGIDHLFGHARLVAVPLAGGLLPRRAHALGTVSRKP